MILFIKQIDIEGPETIGSFFQQKGYDIKVAELYAGDSLPDNFNCLEAVICLGGPMNVYEEEAFLFLKAENDFIQKILQHEIPYMGICLGSQLLAKATEAEVVNSPQKEIGFSHIRLTADGKSDPLLKDIPENVLVFQWHEDMFQIPQKGILLAASEACPHQAFRIGPNAYGLQFHVEITDKSIREWSDRYFKDEKERDHKKQAMLKDYQTYQTKFDETANMLYSNFLRIIRRNKATL